MTDKVMDKITLIEHPHQLQNLALELRQKGEVGFVPTMGALHEGHLSLVQACKNENTHCIVSIFVNPTQFNDPKDLERYPRTLEKDLELLKHFAPLIVFHPTEPASLYPDNFEVKVIETVLSEQLCGAHRPGHFQGVLTIVLKLIMLSQPHRLYMGEKDYQQLKLVQKMIEAFFIPAQVRPIPTVRDENGLALSSRNERLSPEGRKKASLIYQSLKTIPDKETCKKNLESHGFKVEYLEDWEERRLIAAWWEGVRLIDNVSIHEISEM